MTSVAIIVGSSQGIGLQLARIYLSQSKMHVVALSRNSQSAKEAILDTSKSIPFLSSLNAVDHTSEDAFKMLEAKDRGSIFDSDRLTAIDVDVINEESIRKASEQVQSAFGKDSVRLIFNVAGKLAVEKSLAQVEYEEMLAQFQMNTFAPLLAMKHFTPLLQSAKTLSSMKEDLSNGLLPESQNIIANMSARVGSINDNQRGGWYSYRASKAAQNQITRTASLELAMRKVPAICVGLHPGTVRTDLSKDFTGGPGVKQDEREKEKTAERRKKGEFEADESASLLTGVISRLTNKDSGLIWDYSGKQVPY